MTTLAEKRCVPCEKGAKPLPPERARDLFKEIPGWRLEHNRLLRQELILKDFDEAVRLINEIAKIADAEDHHPDLHLTGYRRLTIELSTHSVGGLTENDFVLAAKIEALPRELKK